MYTICIYYTKINKNGIEEKIINYGIKFNTKLFIENAKIL